MSERIRVLLVDDSAFARKVMRDLLSAEDDVDVIGFARDGVEALEKIRVLRPAVVTLDLVMPHLDGVGVIQTLCQWADRPHVVVVTTLDEASEIGVAALEAGAFEVVQKPTAIAEDRLYDVRPRLLAAIRAASSAPRGAHRRLVPSAPIVIAEGARTAFDVVVIGASTGGPQAVSALLAALPASFPAPVAIVLHMPVGYTASYARRIDRDCVLDVLEAHDEVQLVPGRVVIARAGIHLVLARIQGAGLAHLDVHPRDSIHTPSVDVLFTSAASVWGSRVLGVVLTGMGDDGLKGAQAIRASGGRVFAESEASCVVFGMPRVVVESGLADEVVPLEGMASAIVEAVTDGSRGRVRSSLTTEGTSSGAASGSPSSPDRPSK